MIEEVKNPSKEYKVDQDNELRVEADSNCSGLKLELLEGRGEIFGSELVIAKKYEFGPNAKFSVFTWFGCKVRLSGNWEAAYVSKDTPMNMYLNTHAALEEKRKTVEEAGDDSVGPRVLVVGPTDVGKSTLCKILLNYAVRCRRKPTLIDLNVTNSEISIPGTIGALTVDRPADPVYSFDHKSPVIYHYGHTKSSDNVKLYELLIQRLAHIFSAKTVLNKEVRESGCIIDTCGWTKGDGYKSILDTAREFNADVVLVIDSERLYNDLKRDLPDFVDVVSLPKSPGVAETLRAPREMQDEMIKDYFYGPQKLLFPRAIELGFDEVKLYKIGAPELPAALLPYGEEAEDRQTKLMKVEPTPEITYHLLSMSMADDEDEDISETNVGGFLCVQAVDMEKRTITVLSPAPSPLPRKHFLLMDIRYVEKC